MDDAAKPALSISVANAVADSIILSKSELACSMAPGVPSPWLQDVLTEGRFDLRAACATSA